MRSNNRLTAYVATLDFWLIIAVFISFVVFKADTQLIALALLAFTVTLATTNILRYVGWMAAVVSIAIYSLVEINLKGANTSVLIPIGYFSIGVLITSGLGAILTRELVDLNFKIDNNQKLIDELRLYDPITGLMRYQQALRLLKSEIIRCQRYKRNVCLLLFQIENNGASLDKPTTEDIQSLERQMSGALMSSVRSSDIPFEGDGYGAVLTETNMDGAKIVVNRLTNYVVDKVRVPIIVGVAQYPEDGITETELSRAAEAALEHASKIGKTFVQYDQISNITKSSEPGKTNLLKKLKSER